MLRKFRKVLLRPFWKLYKSLPILKYRPQSYWKARLAKYGFDLKGVGNCTLSSEDNEQMYSKAREIFLELCSKEVIDYKAVRILDVGCGTGFYAKTFHKLGVSNYLGIDITDQLHPRLRKDFPEFEFKKLDIGRQKLKKTFDLIIMIDVTQHIVSDKKFSFAMQNIRSHLADNAVFIVTSWLSEQFVHRRDYEVARPISYYETEFPDFCFSEPMRFRDKYIFSIKKHVRENHDLGE